MSLLYGPSKYLSPFAIILSPFAIILISALISTLAFYFSGKLIKVRSKNFTFLSCLVLLFGASFLDGYISDANQWLRIAVFTGLVLYLTNKTYKVEYGTAAIMTAVGLATSLATSYLMGYLYTMLSSNCDFVRCIL